MHEPAAPPDPPGTPGPHGRWLAPGDAFLRSFLRLPELALVDESSAAERQLHEALRESPRCSVDAGVLEAVEDEDVRANYAMFLGFRDAVLAAGSLEAWYLAQVRGGRIAVPPVFIDLAVQAIVRGLVDRDADPFERRAAQLLYRAQRITISEGRVLAADREVLDTLSEPSVDPIASLLARSAASSPEASLPVLRLDNAPAAGDDQRERAFVLDLTHEISSEVGHGLTFTLARAHSGLSALARVLERWIAHFLGVDTTIRPLQRIDDAAWAWHIGLDAEATAILNDLYRGASVDEARLHRLLGLFRLDFVDPSAMRPALAGKPVYLGLAMSEDQVLRVKAQNLLVNLPLAEGA
ncbi:MAG TPA: DUF6352 family protein [Caldimonas sp.]|jgi:hypothetical protein|nr:DUF6352 family protein [Caldimonas sp.]HEX2539854.1 DUF6352 family protein [Caldimonas sp.]